MTDVRLRLIEVLAFPRLFAVQSISPRDCPHNGRFDAGDPRCGCCDHGPECEWLESSEPFVDLASQPREDLVQALRFAVDYIDANNHRPGNRIATCVCESCRWLQKADRLLREIDGRAVVAKHVS